LLLTNDVLDTLPRTRYAFALLAYAFAAIMVGTTLPTPMYALYADRMHFGVLTTTVIYATYAGSYSKTYGSIAAGVILLLWLNYSAWAILFGAELNAALDRQADIHAAGGEHAGLVQPARRRR